MSYKLPCLFYGRLFPFKALTRCIAAFAGLCAARRPLVFGAWPSQSPVCLFQGRARWLRQSRRPIAAVMLEHATKRRFRPAQNIPVQSSASASFIESRARVSVASTCRDQSIAVGQVGRDPAQKRLGAVGTELQPPGGSGGLVDGGKRWRRDWKVG